MSFLTPLYILGLLAVAAPIVFHLIRRTPRGEVPFSSLMFLSPTPPRLTRRSRLDHWLLLLLRATALCLLALAFARPFLRQAARLDVGNVDRERVAVLIDTSASMRRGDLWPRAQALAGAAIAASRPGDHLAVFAFDATTKPVLSFAESSALEPGKRQAVARSRLEGLSPSWGGTDLGQALIDAVGAIEDVADATEKTAKMPRRIVLISDLPQGGRLDALGDFEWPSDVELDLRTVAVAGSNAGLQGLAAPAEGQPSGPTAPLRVRVANDPDSRQESFTLNWVDDKGARTGKPEDVYVPPGESRVVRMPRPPDSGAKRSLRLQGDTYTFDNTLFLATEPKEDATVLYLGNDAVDDPAGLLYYLQRVFPETPRRSVRVVSQAPGTPWEGAPPLVVLAAETTPETSARLLALMRGGGTVLYVVKATGPDATLAALAETAPVKIEEGTVRINVMLGEIAFDHPLFASLAGAQFNDFTKIHFWKYRRIPNEALGEARILARFENGDPAIAEKLVGKGRLVVLASGWNPLDSQLARSSKFVPLMASLLEGRNPTPLDAGNHLVFDRVPLHGSGLVVHKPDGATVTTASDAAYFNGTDQPGVYTIDTPAGARSFAVNLDPLESKTTPLHVETLEQFGCRLVNHSRKTLDREQLRQMHNVELESRQKLWRWLILTAIGVLIAETWLAGRATRPLAEGLTT